MPPFTSMACMVLPWKVLLFKMVIHPILKGYVPLLEKVFVIKVGWESPSQYKPYVSLELNVLSWMVGEEPCMYIPLLLSDTIRFLRVDEEPLSSIPFTLL